MDYIGQFEHFLKTYNFQTKEFIDYKNSFKKEKYKKFDEIYKDLTKSRFFESDKEKDLILLSKENFFIDKKLYNDSCGQIF